MGEVGQEINNNARVFQKVWEQNRNMTLSTVSIERWKLILENYSEKESKEQIKKKKSKNNNGIWIKSQWKLI